MHLADVVDLGMKYKIYKGVRIAYSAKLSIFVQQYNHILHFDNMFSDFVLLHALSPNYSCTVWRMWLVVRSH